ncbi:RNA polymerase-associated protein RapA [Sansalvadorimonas sp. 2012CJ34-2]|uniref:RNA polymerase-associated protein RapA n=1 Tax=Parendozoicomonas callyspongiae TaxID=2942213 RepID=A0ABT0PE02_9GAMM|nr:RNA polymerase-associated protein RapA [Sansalvadorimonas sp. 2012CJ34-2]MCL6269614.1 RNA polymerase-associated protein RapA [Sansalvadorimonas sp. 2012CJ34-2]
MASFVPGQRWISDTEIEQGLGTILTFDARTVTLLYPATGETRVYRLENSPLTRVRFEPGDSVASHEGWILTVSDVQEKDGLLCYTGTDENGTPRELPEAGLDNFIEFNKPQDRLLAGQIDLNSNFSLRYETLSQYNRLCQSPWLGLAGARASLIPHQLHIAHEVADRHAPRVLLADEVGLGKTIEAGLIINRQLLTGRASRVLILVPEALVHQWLVEMLRRFNMHFSVFDEERCRNSDGENPFSSEQLVLASIDFLRNSPEHQEQALEAGWDLMVIDEAHHLEWDEENGAGPDYTLVENLAENTPGVLLLTATPEQLGQAGHFARLRLLDPDRFHSLTTFQEEEARYEPIAEAARELLDTGKISDSAATNLRDLLGTEADGLIAIINDDGQTEAQHANAKEQLIRTLLDRHGTGRILFRNTRAAVPGFPGRAVQGYPQELPELYSIALEENTELEQQVFPELGYQAQIRVEDMDPWWKVDPRIDWMTNLLKLLRKDKVLVICANKHTAMDLENALRISAGTQASVFHEDMSIVERDRAAAWFADEEYGAQVLICSEIGSEGRNFQFAHHLVLFDMPANPDLLEQRIGRLDRIGQEETIRIHVPYVKGTAQEKLFDWYNTGLNAFADTCPAGSVVYSRHRDELEAWLCNAPAEEGESFDFDSLVERSREMNEEVSRHLRLGRDRLLELNSRGAGSNRDLVSEICSEDTPKTLSNYVDKLFESFGLETEEHSQNALVVRPGSHMTVTSYPGVPTDGTTITFDRDNALSREDMQFVTWEHPMVREGMDILLTSETGNTACCIIKSKGLKPGLMLMEAIFVVEASGDRHLQLERFLPPTVLRTLIDPALNDLGTKVSFKALDPQLQKLKTSTARKVVKNQREAIVKMAKAAEDHARTQVADIVNDSCQKLMNNVTQEIRRLAALKAVNPNIRDEEIEFLKQQAASGYQVLQKAQMRLDAIRLIFTT